LSIDYETTWNSNLRHDYLEENGYYFRLMWLIRDTNRSHKGSWWPNPLTQEPFSRILLK
jgi:hypothetical protein